MARTSQPTIGDLRLTFVWVETLFSLLRDEPPAAAPMRFLGRSDLYANAFASLSTRTDLTAPWPVPSRHNFWRYYLQCDPLQMPPSQAWRFLVPFRQVPLKLRAATEGQRLSAEGFYYPFGMGLALTVTDTTERALFDAVASTVSIRSGTLGTVSDSAGDHGVTLQECADRCFAVLRTHAFGPAAAAGTRSLDPFTVLTVVRATDAPSDNLAPGSPVHRALEAWTGWRSSWRTDALPDPEERLIQTQGGSGRVLYGRRRARVAWFPPHFASQGRPLSCYHRNLSLTSLQVESLGTAVDHTLELCRGDLTMLSVHHGQSVAHASDMLARFYAAPVKMYRGWSAPRQIEDNGFVEPTNTLRALMSKDPMHPAH